MFGELIVLGVIAVGFFLYQRWVEKNSKNGPMFNANRPLTLEERIEKLERQVEILELERPINKDVP